ncbi:unnamed protein product [Euphydryas editha]|uniref:Mos1 transposase HTH domain-containing protein n=1 Tax=Euphydryas editha TaxID=104508 RepID=A0AAU9V5M1_EUPED|nr:unnamed protein product [Euphydryas editha]
MENTEEYKRHILYFFFKSEENATKAAEKFNNVRGDNFISVRTAQKWFQRFNTVQQKNLKVSKYFDSKPEYFYKQGIYKLPNIWQLVVDNNGKYIID